MNHLKIFFFKWSQFLYQFITFSLTIKKCFVCTQIANYKIDFKYVFPHIPIVFMLLIFLRTVPPIQITNSIIIHGKNFRNCNA